MRAPAQEEIAEMLLDGRGGKRRRAALIIPSMGGRDALREHIEALGRQTSGDFDVFFVYGANEALEPAPGWMKSVHLRERKRVGPAGAFYIGQKAALEEGYGLVILADSDARPESEDLIEKLIETASSGSVAMPMVDYRPSLKPQKGGLINHYGCIPRAAFEKAGLAFLPIIMGGEELELLDRIREAGFGVRIVDALVSHPKRMPLPITPASTLYHYQRGLAGGKILRGRFLAAYRAIASDMLLGSAFLCLGKARLAGTFFMAMWGASGLEFGFRSGIHEHEDAEPSACDSQPRNRMVIDYKAGIPVAEDFFERAQTKGLGGWAALRAEWAAGFISGAPKAFGRDITLEGRGRPVLDLPLIFLSRSACIEWAGKRHAITRNRGFAAISASCAAFALIAPFAMGVSALLLFRGVIEKLFSGKSSDGYGLPELKVQSAE